MNRKLYYVLGALLLVGFAGFSMAAFRTSLTPYVSFAEATRPGSASRTVQIAGGLVKESAAYDEASSALHFRLIDTKTGETLPVRYHGVRPANLDEAISIVAIGRYDRSTAEFAAEKLLVKCPSKYQGAEVTKTY